MKQEDKELLLKDLCTRLPYRVKIELMPITRGKCTTLTPIILHDYFISNDVNYLPYLRPMSSMTEEEKYNLLKFGGLHISESEEVIDVSCLGFERHCEVQDWLNEHHFDYRGLIEKGLALEAPNGMYK